MYFLFSFLSSVDNREPLKFVKQVNMIQHNGSEEGDYQEKRRDATVIMQEVWKVCAGEVVMIAARDKQK